MRHTEHVLHQLARQAITLVLIGVTAVGCSDAPITGTPTPALPPRAPTLARSPETYAFTTIDVPGALSTSPQGIGAGGEIVGFYGVSGGMTRGFLLDGGKLTTITYPGASFTAARGIGPDGDIVGNYRFPGQSSVVSFGFRLTSTGDFIAVNYPGRLHTIPQRILADGSILGCRHDDDLMATMRGVVISREGSTETDAFASMHNGATPDGKRIVGFYTDMMTSRTDAYMIDNGVFVPFAVPGSLTTVAWDVNPRGDVVGIFQDGVGVHGFVLTRDGFTVVDFPGATATRLFGINPKGEVVGTYIVGGVTHGFLGRPTH